MISYCSCGFTFLFQSFCFNHFDCFNHFVSIILIVSIILFQSSCFNHLVCEGMETHEEVRVGNSRMNYRFQQDRVEDPPET